MRRMNDFDDLVMDEGMIWFHHSNFDTWVYLGLLGVLGIIFEKVTLHQLAVLPKVEPIYYVSYHFLLNSHNQQN